MNDANNNNTQLPKLSDVFFNYPLTELSSIDSIDCDELAPGAYYIPSYYHECRGYSFVYVSFFIRNLTNDNILVRTRYSTSKRVVIFQSDIFEDKEKLQLCIPIIRNLDIYVNNDYGNFIKCIDPEFWFIKTLTAKKNKQLEELQHEIKETKKRYLEQLNTVENLQSSIGKLENTKAVILGSIQNNENASIEGSDIYYTVKNIVCEDIQAIKPDIYLGDITFEISLKKGIVKIYTGTESRDLCGGRRHPHEVGAGGICLGTMGLEFSNNIENLNLDAVFILLNKWATSYNSADSYGNDNHIYWLDKPVEKVRCVRYSEDYPKEDCVYSELEVDYIPIERAKSLSDGRGYVWDDNAVKIKGFICWTKDPKVVKVGSEYYLISDDRLVVDNDNVYHLRTNLMWSNLMNRYIFPNEEVMKWEDNDYITLQYFNDHIDSQYDDEYIDVDEKEDVVIGLAIAEGRTTEHPLPF